MHVLSAEGCCGNDENTLQVDIRLFSVFEVTLRMLRICTKTNAILRTVVNSIAIANEK